MKPRQQRAFVVIATVLAFLALHALYFPRPKQSESNPTSSLRYPIGCQRPIDFLPHSQQRKRPILFASFPGSGNTWVRFLLEQGSRVLTGSVYFDDDLKVFFKGETTQSPQVLAVKTHFPCESCWTRWDNQTQSGIPVEIENSGSLPEADHVLYLLRSPFDSFLAEFHRLKTGSHTAKLSPEDFLIVPRLLQKAHFNQTAHHNPSWDQFIDFRLHALKTSLEIHAQPRLLLTRHPRNFVIFYEDMVAYPQVEMFRVFSWLHDIYKRDGIELELSPEEMTECAYLHNLHDQGRFRRKHEEETGKYNPYTVEQIHRICSTLENWWFDDVWGECRLGLLQVERRKDVAP